MISALAPAKVNLYLHVAPLQADGYHPLASLMAFADIGDRLDAERDDGLSLAMAGPFAEGLSAGEDNLVMRAARLLQTRSAMPRGARIHLEKRIPQQAGLGGGSSDAATALTALNELWDLHLPLDDLATLAADLGSDVPFFLRGPSAVIGGRGELVRPITHNTAAAVVLAKPATGLSTGEVYSRLQAMPQLPDEEIFMRSAAQVMLNALNAGDVSLIARAMVNDLERSAYIMLPDLTRLRERMRLQGCLGVQLCGSGSALVGICADVEVAKAAAAELLNDCPWTWAGPWTMAA